MVDGNDCSPPSARAEDLALVKHALPGVRARIPAGSASPGTGLACPSCSKLARQRFAQASPHARVVRIAVAASSVRLWSAWAVLERLVSCAVSLGCATTTHGSRCRRRNVLCRTAASARRRSNARADGQSGGCVDVTRRIAPALVAEASAALSASSNNSERTRDRGGRSTQLRDQIDRTRRRTVRLAAEPTQVADLKIAPPMAPAQRQLVCELSQTRRL